MDKFRKVSSSSTAESEEVHVSGAILNPDGSYSLSVGDISSWPSEVDFITYSRDVDSKVDETTRVVWSGTKSDNSTIIANRVGGQTSYVPDPTNFATVVPTHYWANSLVDGVSSSLPGDGLGGILTTDDRPICFFVGSSAPLPIAGRTILWLRPLE